MIYIDTDVLIHAYVIQDQGKHDQARKAIERAVAAQEAIISTLNIQEALYVLDRRLDLDVDKIQSIYDALMRMRPLSYDAETLRRAMDIAREVGFRNINDCIHTAIAESHCTELITYNRRDFSRIANFARIGITIL